MIRRTIGLLTNVFPQDGDAARMIRRAMRGTQLSPLPILKALEARGVELGRDSYLAAAVQCMRTRRLTTALQLIAQLRDKGCAMDRHLFTVLTLIHGRRRDVEGVRSVMRQMHEYGMPIPIHCINALLRAMLAKRHPQLFATQRAVFYRKVEQVPNSRTWPLLIASSDSLSTADFVHRTMCKQRVPGVCGREVLAAFLTVCHIDKKWGRKRAKDDVAAFPLKLGETHYKLWLGVGLAHEDWEYVVDVWGRIQSEGRVRPTKKMAVSYLKALRHIAGGDPDAARRATALTVKLLLQHPGLFKQHKPALPSRALSVFVACGDTDGARDFFQLCMKAKVASDAFVYTYNQFVTRPQAPPEEDAPSSVDAASFFQMPVRGPTQNTTPCPHRSPRP